MDRSALISMIAPVVAPLGLEVDRVDILSAGQRRLIRVRLDGDGPTGTGPDMDEIAAATKLISAALDEADMGSQPYVLEVSSRGVDSPLTTAAHFRRNKGRLVAVPSADGTPFTARIVSSDDETVTLAFDDGGQRSYPLAEVAKAVVQVEFNRSNDKEEEE